MNRLEPREWTQEQIEDQVEITKLVTWRGSDYCVNIYFQIEREGHGRDDDFPVPSNELYTDALIGFELTSRYAPAILDQGQIHGHVEPFVFDPNDILAILQQVRNWWPEAQAIMWTKFY